MSIFIRYESGTRHDVERDILADIREFLAAIDAGATIDGYLNTVIKEVLWGGQVCPDVESTWFALLREFFELHRPPHCPDPTTVLRDQLEVLRTLRDGGTPEELWRRAKPVMLERVDRLSGWDYSPARSMAERYQRMRQADGRYIEEIDGVSYELVGPHGFEDMKVEYLLDQARRVKYSYLHETCGLIALCAISVHHRTAPGEYPDALRVVLNDHFMLGFSWYLLSWPDSSRLPWRPPLRYCKPEFLVSDLVGEYASRVAHALSPAAPPPPDPVPHDTRFQHEFALETDLRIGDSEEANLTFNGMRFRWINGSRTFCPIIIMGSNNQNDHRHAFETVSELLSIMCFQTRSALLSTFGASGPTRLNPMIRQPRKLADTVYPSGIEIRSERPMTPNRKLALALYREGMNSESRYYRFLCYYKILQIPFLGKAVVAWINSHALPEGRVSSERVRELFRDGVTDIADYLYDTWRNAIAHVQHEPTVNPDNYELSIRISKDVYLVDDLARTMIQSDELG